MNLPTLMGRQIHLRQLLIQCTQIGEKCAEKKSIEEILQSEDTILINDSDGGIVDDEQDIRKMTASAALDSLDAVKCFAEIQEDKQMNVMPN